MNKEELKLVLKNHSKWLVNKDTGTRANLSRAYLRGANLSGTIGNNLDVFSIQTGSWPIVYTKEVMQIGCQRHNIDDWFSFDELKISEMDEEAIVFWQKWKPILQMILEHLK